MRQPKINVWKELLDFWTTINCSTNNVCYLYYGESRTL